MLSSVMTPPICEFLDPLVPYGFIDSKDARCFLVNAWLGPGTFILFLAAVAGTFSLSFFQGACLAAIEDRENRIKGIEMHGDLNLGVSSKWAYMQFRVFKTLFLIDRSIKEEYRDIRQEQKDRRRAKVRKWKNKFTPKFLKKGRLLEEGEEKEEEESSSGEENSDDSFETEGNDSSTRDSSFERESSIVLPPSRPAPKELMNQRQESASHSNSRNGNKSTGEKKTMPRGDSSSDSFQSRDSSIIAAPPRKTDALPPGWTEQQHENGVYYWNFQTGVTTWDRPQWGKGESKPPPAPMSEASESFDDDDSFTQGSIQMKALGKGNSKEIV
uniref:WW domain-containing protein n=1 Tax=Triparma pacifica TaxID=91992 RepID=A0A7S2QV79_9STRA|mmetsp:Transcript_1720/g.3273  ORF Transcript_1720/g.3273 Transcript_1720/m.3273 type:complete len:328 (+) Transcript_1720:1-984(+)